MGGKAFTDGKRAFSTTINDLAEEALIWSAEYCTQIATTNETRKASGIRKTNGMPAKLKRKYPRSIGEIS